MSDYIKKSDAIEAIEEIDRPGVICYGYNAKLNLGAVLDRLVGLPSVNVVEVVRCKDCKKYMTIHCTCDGCCISDEWYCADGERKE